VPNIKLKLPKTLDYEKIGLLVGIEFHQQLDTPFDGDISDPATLKENGSKLFCRCPSIIREDEADIKVLRELRAVAGESGSVDVAAAFETKKKRRIHYHAYSDTTCMIELDSEPIMEMNPAAVDTVLLISRLLKCKPVDELQICRKNIVDGSTVSGFQRTILVALGTPESYITLGDTDIQVDAIFLEEDSSRHLKAAGDEPHFSLDRLGIPLIEVATHHDIKNPLLARDFAKYMGSLLRATGLVKRGLGTIRQDLNVSIDGGTRTELKGIQDLQLIDTYVHNEALRQLRMIELVTELKVKKQTMDDFNPTDLSKLFKGSKCKPISKALKSKKKVYGALMPKMKGLLGIEIQPDYRVGTELSEIAKVTSGVGGIFHCDELPKYGISEKDVSAIEKELGCQSDDGFILIADGKEKCLQAMNRIKEVIEMWYLGIPEEVRRPRPDGTTAFLRPLPGRHRMYPETDSLPVRIIQERLDKIKKIKVELPKEKKQRFLKDLKLSQQLAEELVLHPRVELFDQIVSEKLAQPTLVATTITQSIVQIRRDGGNVELITDDIIWHVFKLLKKGEVSKETLMQLLEIYASGKFKTITTALESLGIEKLSLDDLAKIVSEEADKIADMITKRGERATGMLMGKVMARTKGAIDGKIVNQEVKEEIKKRL